VRVRRLREHAVLPVAAYPGDAGRDLRAAERVVVPGRGRAPVCCGVAIELPPGHCGLVLPRSGLAERHGVTVLNAPGLVDEGFRGELRVILHNTDPAPFVVEPGMRIAQLVVVRVAEVELDEAEELAASPRGARGFGSSGLA
jgi:dUTP pyrophosphatase